MSLRVIRYKDIKGSTFEETTDNVLSLKKGYPDGVFLTVVVYSQDVNDHQRMYLRKGQLPFSHAFNTLTDKIVYVEDKVIKILKDRSILCNSI